MPDQRNGYKGSPPRAWLRLTLVALDGSSRDIDVLADTGNPCALIVGDNVMRRFNRGKAPNMTTNFGAMEGGWMQIQIPEISLDCDSVCYSSNAVVQAVQNSHADFRGLAGLPLLRMLEYGGDADEFWIQPAQ